MSRPFTGPARLILIQWTCFVGFETAPRIWGSKDRRPRTKVKDIASGFRAGGENIVYGIYDGLTAMAVDPYLGVKQEASSDRPVINGGRSSADHMGFGV